MLLCFAVVVHAGKGQPCVKQFQERQQLLTMKLVLLKENPIGLLSYLVWSIPSDVLIIALWICTLNVPPRSPFKLDLNASAPFYIPHLDPTNAGIDPSSNLRDDAMHISLIWITSDVAVELDVVDSDESDMGRSRSRAWEKTLLQSLAGYYDYKKIMKCKRMQRKMLKKGSKWCKVHSIQWPI